MASVLFLETEPALTLVILLVVSVPCAALNAPAALFHSRESSLRSPTESVRLVMLVVLVDTLSLVVLSWEPLTASVLPAVRSPAVTLVILLVASVPCLALNAVPFQSRASFSRVSTSAFRVVILLAFVAISAVLVAISVVLVAILAVLSAILAVLVAISVVLVKR